MPTYSNPNDPTSSVQSADAGVIGSGGGAGKTGGIFGIGDENVQQQLAASGYRMYAPTAAPNVSGLFQTDQNPELQFRQGELGLMNTLQGEALGNGPSAAIGTLTAGRDQNVANLMAAIASGRGSPGTMSGALSAAGAAGQQAANQAAIIRAQEQARAQSELGSVAATGAAGDLGEQQLRANQGGNLAGIQNNDWQFGQGMNAEQQAALNGVIAQGVTGANSSQQALLGQSIGALGGAASGLLSAGTGGLSSLIPHGGGGGNSFAGAATAPGGATVNMPGYAGGHVADHGPEIAKIGEKGPEIVLPVHRDGTPDMQRATDPRLKWILEQHGPTPAGAKASGMPGPMPAADHGLLGHIMALRSEIQALRAGR